jgi:signal transduction histidine kinase
MAIPLRILILEDNAVDAELMLHELRRAGYDPTADRVETEQAYRDHLQPAPDIILADFSMPEFDALLALEILQELQLDIPFIIVTGTIGEERAVQVMHRGATDFILKDRMGRLGQSVTQALEQKRLRKAKRLADIALYESKELSRKVQEAQLREQGAREQAEQDNRVKDQFFATLSHELRSPLTPILGWCRMLLDGGLDEETRIKGLTVIMRNVKMQSRLVDDILDVSRIITGKLLLNIVTVDANRIIEAAMEVVRPIADSKKMVLERTSPRAAVMISGDPYRLEQVFWNLLTNAVKFTPDGGKIQIGIKNTGAHAQILIKDSGMGIRPDFLPHVFDRFSQADSSSTREHGGLGIGLSLVKHLTELHGGTVGVESEGEGLGTTFTVSLPLPKEKSLEAPQTIASETFQVNDSLFQNVKLLIVDDEPDARELLLYTFKRCGAEVKTAGTVREALGDYRNQKPDLLLSDLGMPFDDGFELIKEIRTLEAQSGKYTPAIALSAFARDEDRTRSLAAGFQLHIPKPIDPIELIIAVSKLLKVPQSVPLGAA